MSLSKIWLMEKLPAKPIGVYLILIGILFYLLWLSEVLPAMINNTTPAIIIETGLLTNPVHVLDLSIILPAFIIMGIYLLRKKYLGLLLAPAILVFSILMNITIGFMAVLLKIKGLEENLSVTVIMGVFILISLFFLITYLRNIKIRKINCLNIAAILISYRFQSYNLSFSNREIGIGLTAIIPL
jgi:hypothetical protein